MVFLNLRSWGRRGLLSPGKEQRQPRARNESLLPPSWIGERPARLSGVAIKAPNRLPIDENAFVDETAPEVQAGEEVNDKNRAPSDNAEDLYDEHEQMTENRLLLETRRELEEQHSAATEKIQQLTRQLEESHKEHTRKQLADREKSEQQDYLLRQSREEASASANRHQEELNKLYHKLNALQSGQQSWGDDQIVEAMRNLNQNLDRWVKANFKDATKLESCFSARWNLVLGNTVRALRTLSCLSARSIAPGSETAFHTWRIATSMAIEGGTKEKCETAFADIIQTVEGRFGVFCSTDSEPRKRQLEKLLRKCADFKVTLSRQKQAFFFHCSPAGVEFSLPFMTFGGGDGQPAGKVRWSLWPAIMKWHDDTGRDVLETELVWTME
ncbi:uncharacterized protein BO80DRAFT_431351 [Aspergillus ibericus CBS 121593]|uniref:Uncharacterized protein n=1 Tax=Aspergillus ibericus CBS 121593 TaxID=1448316 RepID=A0A395HBU2_9EURO|nr:hypothetical protein BO80DRAFT_431351 [Aspergillus ibericus CBS 121593]RAL05411.1 hypothetical protein BO80DRAFT_431351 [Aspergillus ibericus CBS 121593]